MTPFACVRDTDLCGPLSRCPSSTTLEFERLLVRRFSPGLLCAYEESIGMAGAARAGVRAGKVGIPGGRGAGRPGIRVTWLVD